MRAIIDSDCVLGALDVASLLSRYILLLEILSGLHRLELNG